MKSIIKEYLAWKGTYAPRACVNYRIWLDRLVEVCGEKGIEEYNVEDIIKYRGWLEDHYGPYSVQFATIVLKNFLQYCKIQNYKCLHPALIRLPRAVAKSHRAVKENEFTKILSVIPNHSFAKLRDLLIVRMLWDTGVRVSELCDLDISQIDETKRTAVIQTKKNNKKRIIVWSDETHTILLKYLPFRLEVNRYQNASALFLGNLRGKRIVTRLNRRSVERIVKNYVERAGIKEKITPHSFRHGWAHKRRDQNAPLAFIQKGLGHMNPISTFVYEQYNDQEFEHNAKNYLQAA